jgi:hypothetical protein
VSGKKAREKRKEAMATDDELKSPLSHEDLTSEKGHLASVIRQMGGQINSPLTPEAQKLPMMLARAQLISTYALIEIHAVLVVAGEMEPSDIKGLVS